MAAFDLPPIRRIVTGDDAQGHSRIIEDAPCACVRTVPERPHYRSVNVWRTTEAPALIEAPDTIAQHQGILPPGQGGNILRIIDIPPESKDPQERQRQRHARLIEAGVKIFGPPVLVPNGVVRHDAGNKQLLYFLDPEGVLLELTEYN